ncbi:MAG: hypothetical protein ACU837_02215 [Gammaproteobacteria bacterium]
MKTTINRSWILAACGLLGLTSTCLAAAQTPYLALKKAEIEVESEGPAKTLKLEIETQADIPVDGKSGAFGYAALSDGGNNVLVLVTHLPIDDSSHENPKSGFHVHVLDLKDPSPACKGANFEVDLENSSKNKAFNTDYKYRIKGHEIEISDVPVADLGDAGIETVASFTLKPILDAAQKPTNLCVSVIDQK